MSQQQVIAVLGATGLQGGAAARALLRRGFEVRALSRSAESDAAEQLRAAGARVVPADPEDVESLRAAFDGADGVSAMTVPTGPGGVDAEIRQGFAIAEAAAAAGVQHIVYSSVGGAERNTRIPHFDSKYRVEQRLAELRIPTTLVRPTFFMDNLLRNTTDTDGTIVISQPLSATVPMQMIATVDIGKVVARVMLDPQFIGDAVEIAGDEVTGDQIAAAFQNVAARPARYQELPLSFLDGDQDLHRMFEWFQEPVAYRGDFDETRRLDPDVLSLKAWLRTTTWAAPPETAISQSQE